MDRQSFEKLFIYASDKKLDLYYPHFLKTIKLYEINTVNRIAAFCAQIAHESGSLTYVEEIATGSNYDGRKDLGNLEPEAIEAAKAKNTTPGRFYKGHGLLQITGYYNHKNCGIDLGIDLVHYPNLLTQPKYAMLSAGWFWKKNCLNYLADLNQFTKITRKINGGLNGQEERNAFYAKNISVLTG